MGKNNPRYMDAFREMNRLREMISALNVELLISSDRSYKNHLHTKIEDLKERIGWLLLDCGEYLRGYVLYRSLPWKTHGKHRYNGMSRALIEMEFYDKARKLLKKGMKRFPEAFPLIITKGMLHQKTCDYFDALRSFEHALQLDHHNPYALYNKAVSLNMLGYYEDAASVLHDLMEGYPDEHDYLIEMGYSYLMTGYPEDALQYYRKAQTTGYKSPNMYCGLYGIYLILGLQNEALYIAQEGMNAYPDEPAMYENLGECYFERGWIADAKEILKEGVKKFPEDYRLRELLNKIEDETDNPDKGKKPPIGLIILLIMLLRKMKEQHSGRKR